MSDAHRYLAVVRLDPRDRRFVIRAPDFPDLEVQCERFDEIDGTAEAAIRRSLGALNRNGRQPPDPTSKQSLENRPEYRECFVIPVEAHRADAHDSRSRGTPAAP